MGDSPDPPPPPPDYTKEKAAFAVAEEAKRKQEADAYNALVGNFNSSIAGYGSGLADLKSSVGGLGIKDDELFTDYSNKINSLQNTLYGQQFNAPKPYWESTVYSAWGPVSVGMPSLMTPDTNLKDSFITQLGDVRSQLGSLQALRKAEEQKINNFDSQLYNSLGGLSSQANSAGFGDLGALNSLKAQYDAMKASRDSFTSDILGDYTSNVASGINPLMASLNDRLTSLFNDRNTELQRIKEYENSITAKAGGFSNSLSGLNIGNVDGMNALRDQINAYKREVGRFSTPIVGKDFDLSQELGDVASVEDKLSQLFADRQTELGKVNSFQDQMNTAALGLASNARTADVYNLGRLNDLLTQVGLAKQKIGGFSSALPVDVQAASGQLDSAEQLINQLLTQRTNSIGQLQNRFDTQTAGYGNIAGYDETAMQNAMNQLYGFQNNLAPYQGADINPLKQNVTMQIQSIQDKMGQLTAKRAEFETQAQMLLQELQNKQFTGLDQISGGQTQADDLNTQVKLYKATQAMDEIQQIMDRLNSEKSRLEQDAANVASRTLVDSSNPLGSTTNINDLMNRITPEQYAELLAMAKKVQTGAATTDEYNSFLKTLGIGV